MATNFDIELGNSQDNFDIDLNDQAENFVVEFGEITWVVGNDFNKLENRPSYNGQLMTGETNIPAVPTATSQLTNDANYQNANDVSNAISTHNQSTSSHQDIRQAISDETTNRVNADNGLQGQIDAITSASDVVDIVGTYAELQSYDTQHLKDNDVVKVLQDETHNEAMTYWRWSTSTHTWAYIGAEGPYYTKSEANTLLDEKLDADEVPEGFFDGPATIYPTEGTSVEIQGGLKLKAINLKGDTTQQTYSGKNLVNANGTFTYGSTNYRTTSNGDGTITTTSKIGSSRSAGQKIEGLLPNTVYTLSATLISYDGNLTSGYGGQMEIVDSSSGSALRLAGINFGTIGSLPESGMLSFTTPEDVSAIWVSFNGRTTIPSSSAPNPTLVMGELQLEKGATATTYEPYVGGVPAPNPSYPQTVNVVTGTQTITLSDGVVSQDYIVNLGTIELCKIGDYQDYIYKSGDDWYLHKEVGKVVLKGTEGWNYNSGTAVFYASNVVGYNTNGFIPFSDYFVGQNITSYGQLSDNGVAFLESTTNNRLVIKYTSLGTNAPAIQTWLSNNNTTVYYVSATPTDTQITDNALIGQLDNVLKATLYQPISTISSSGDLPAIIKVEAYTEHLNSLLEIAAQAEDTLFVGTDGVSAGSAGLVPAPTIGDQDKYLKSDGTWSEVSGGGGSITPVQTTGTSTTDVMSQNATTSMVFADAGTNSRVQIGSGANGNWTDAVVIGYNATANATNATAVGTSAAARGNSVAVGKNAKAGTSSAHTNTVAIGYNAQASAVGAVAIGRDSSASTKGEINVGTTNTQWGYSSSNYRLLSGIYDGQNAHDAVTVGQVNATIDAINSALGSSIPHIGAGS